MNWTPADQLILALIPLRDFNNFSVKRDIIDEDIINIIIASDSSYHATSFSFNCDGYPVTPSEC